MALLAALLAAGCGTSQRASFMRVNGDGFTFAAPAGWKVKQTRTGTTSAQRGRALVSVTLFRLAKPVVAARLPRAQEELDHVTAQLAAREHGKLTSGSHTPDGARYTVDARDRVFEIRFVLRGAREYELLCIRQRGGDRTACRKLFVSFAPA